MFDCLSRTYFKYAEVLNGHVEGAKGACCRVVSTDGLVAFDLMTFLEIAKRTRKWVCPHTMKNFSIYELQVDAYMQRVLDCLQVTRFCQKNQCKQRLRAAQCKLQRALAARRLELMFPRQADCLLAERRRRSQASRYFATCSRFRARLADAAKMTGTFTNPESL